ncbi:MAG: hypothetical protein K0Q72_818 [Armatimonadetes bacterium]|nr:hypothetical protein [Armatimonadota bacterium]
MRVAYLDCIGGISGDMTLGALLDAGVDRAALEAGLRTLNLPNWELQVGRTRKSGIAGTKVEVVVGGAAAGNAPMMRVPPDDAPLETSGHTHSHSHTHTHSESHTHSHAETYVHDTRISTAIGHRPARTASPTPPVTSTPSGAGNARPPEHLNNAHSHDGSVTRTFGDVAALIRASGLPEVVKERAERVYRRLAEAEAAVHGASLETVHFHEVGAVDSIVDVVGSVYGLYLLGIERVICSPLPNGKGFVRCAHGLMPIPPPATAELLKGCPLRQVDVEGELVTPTGAALASALAESFGPLPGFTVREVGYGAGGKDFPFPNLLRIVVGDDDTAPAEATTVTLIEANIDDMSPQVYDSAFTALFAAGALDVWITPIQMKKNRPAHTLSVLCEPAAAEQVTGVLFAETTTLGVRSTEWKRSCLQREWVSVETPYGAVRVKVGRQAGELRTATPEYEDCRERAVERGVPVKLVQAAATAAAFQQLLAGAGSEEQTR